MGSLVARLRDVPHGDARPLYFDTMEDAADTLERLEGWLLSIAHSDWGEVVADGGITAAMVIQQEAREQLRRLCRDTDVPNYCPPCGENLLSEQVDCPFCGQVSVPIDQPFTCGKGGCPLGGDL
jgi:hypothetical protein